MQFQDWVNLNAPYKCETAYQKSYYRTKPLAKAEGDYTDIPEHIKAFVEHIYLLAGKVLSFQRERSGLFHYIYSFGHRRRLL